MLGPVGVAIPVQPAARGAGGQQVWVPVAIDIADGLAVRVARRIGIDGHVLERDLAEVCGRHRFAPDQ